MKLWSFNLIRHRDFDGRMTPAVFGAVMAETLAEARAELARAYPEYDWSSVSIALERGRVAIAAHVCGLPGFGVR